MRMDVDEPWGDDQSPGVDLTPARAAEPTDGSDAMVPDGHVARESWITCAIDDAAISKNPIELGGVDRGKETQKEKEEARHP